MEEKIILVKGRVQRELFYNEESSFGVYLFYTEDYVESSGLQKQDFTKRRFGTISGNVQRLNIGSVYNMELSETYNRKYDQVQFSPIKVYEKIPNTLAEKYIFLESILTKNQAETLLEAYPEIIQDIIDNKEVDISGLKNISESRFDRIKDKILNNYVLSDLLIMLSPYGITFSQVKAISSLNKNTALIKEMILKNPYVLSDVNGFGFSTVDKIALKMKPNLKNSEERVEAFLKYVLEDEAESNGHTWLLRTDIIGYGRKLIPECLAILKDLLSRDEQTFLHIEGDKIGRKMDFVVETLIHKELERINGAESLAFTRPTMEKIQEIVVETQEKQGFEFSEEQMKTLNSLSENKNVIIVSGGAGSGKTSVVNGISNILEKCETSRPISISQIALSAKASIRMKQVTKRHSTTIHKFLYDLNVEASDGQTESREELIFQSDISDEEKERMESLHNIRSSDVVIIDEFSMVNIYLTLKVLKEIKTGAIIIFVFDYAQLPAIGAGAVAYDLLECSNYNKSKYTKVHRQGEKSGILMDANTIRLQQNPLRQFEKSITTGELKDMTYMFRNTPEEIRGLAVKSFISGVDKFGIDNINIVCPRKNNTQNSAEELNYAIQEILIPKGSVIEYTNPMTKKDFRLGDKVIHRKNMNQENVFNGEVGTVIKIDLDSESKTPVVVKYDYGTISKVIKYDNAMLKHLQLAYALTVHSFQGSENKAIIVVLDKASFMLLDNTMLYTAITRAKERCVLISDPSSFTRCINEHKTLVRNTWLKDILTNGGDEDRKSS